MPKIFVAARRADSKIHGDNVVEALRRVFGAESVERNIDDVPFGVDFREHVYNEVAQYDFILCVIGRQWASIRDDYNRKFIENPADLIRMSIEMALQQNKMVIPVLVDNASMPVPAELPDSLTELCYRRPVEVQSGTMAARDLRRLTDGLQQLVQRQGGQAAPVKPYQPPPPESPPPPDPQPSPLPETVVAPQPEPEIEPEADIEPVPEAPVEASEPPTIAQPRVGVARLIPTPFDWIKIPAGIVTLPDGVLMGHKTVFVESFWLAKYPVTNAQFAQFEIAPDGYGDPAWWDFSPQAQSWRQANPKPKSTAHSGDTLPRTNVTWFEAVAFCRWLTAQVKEHEADYLAGLTADPETFQVLLPTEEQWQRAAQGDDARLFPWGDNFNPNFCNFRTSGPTPVDQFPKGASSFGVLDLAGNVAEWCLMDFSIETADLTTASTRKRRVLRGGSWGASNRDELRVDSRLWLFPDYWNGSSGFRIVQTGGAE